MSHFFDVAVTRDLARSMERCELTFIDRHAIDHQRAAAQHERYCERLVALGLEVIRLPADEAQPDCCFIEDTAVVLDEVAVITCLGSPARRGETPAVERELSKHRPIARIEWPATLDGGDVLVVGRTILVGSTTRTNAAGIEALRGITAPFGYELTVLRVPGCLHLKSAVTALDDETLLANRGLVELEPVKQQYRVVDVDVGEPGAANVLRVRDEVWAHPGYPRTFEKLQGLGVHVVGVDISEFVKAEGALTCKSLLLRKPSA
ncbi:MAG: dimethylargininase [Deltaproteobacteria bacterium]|nr:dimethylargininase [Deltaproteobacteria bacterium]